MPGGLPHADATEAAATDGANRMDEIAHSAKAALRSRQLAARAAVSRAARAEGSAAVRERLTTLSELAACRTLLGYAAFGSEVDLDPFLTRMAAEGRGVFLPWVDGDELGISRVTDLEAELVPGYRGIREPRAIGRLPARIDRVEAAIVPGVAFDRRGGRLGYGGGFFDRLLARLPAQAPVVGVAFDVQLVNAVPRERHDRRVDLIVTETAVIRPGSGCRPNGRQHNEEHSS